MKKSIIGIVTLLLVGQSASLGAQTTADLLTALRTLQSQINVFQADKNATLVTQMEIWIDSATATGFVGWGFHCGPESLKTAIGPRPATLDVLIDGVPAGAPFFSTGPREDVRDAYAVYCAPKGVPVDPGITGILNLNDYPSGQHTIQLRLTDPRGEVRGSNIVVVIK